MGEPDLAAPNAGRVEVCVSCSNSLFPKFDERSSGDVNAVLSGALERSMRGVGGKAGGEGGLRREGTARERETGTDTDTDTQIYV